MKTPKQTFGQVHYQIKQEHEVRGSGDALELVERLRNSHGFFFGWGLLGDWGVENQAAQSFVVSLSSKVLSLLNLNNYNILLFALRYLQRFIKKQLEFDKRRICIVSDQPAKFWF